MTGNCVCAPGATRRNHGIRILFSKYWRSVFWLLTAASDHRGADTEADSYFVRPPFVTSPSLSKWSYLQRIEKGWYIFSNFPAPHFGSLTLKIRNIQKHLHTQEKLESHCTCLGKCAGSEKASEKLSLLLRGQSWSYPDQDSLYSIYQYPETKRTLKAAREKWLLTYKRPSIRLPTFLIRNFGT